MSYLWFYYLVYKIYFLSFLSIICFFKFFLQFILFLEWHVKQLVKGTGSVHRFICCISYKIQQRECHFLKHLKVSFCEILWDVSVIWPKKNNLSPPSNNLYTHTHTHTLHPLLLVLKNLKALINIILNYLKLKDLSGNPFPCLLQKNWYSNPTPLDIQSKYI